MGAFFRDASELIVVAAEELQLSQLHCQAQRVLARLGPGVDGIESLNSAISESEIVVLIFLRMLTGTLLKETRRSQEPLGNTFASVKTSSVNQGQICFQVIS